VPGILALMTAGSLGDYYHHRSLCLACTSRSSRAARVSITIRPAASEVKGDVSIS
jgi:hypothetical protein